MNERVKNIRKALDLNQADFGEQLGVTAAAISKIESSERKVTEQMALAICREFDVNEEWLRTGKGGEGDMFAMDDSSISAVIRDKKLDETSQAVLNAYLKLNKEQREGANTFIFALSQAVLNDDLELLKENIDKAVSEVLYHQKVPNLVKQNLDVNVKMAFADSNLSRYIGEGNVTKNELATLTIPPDSAEFANEYSDIEQAQAAINNQATIGEQKTLDGQFNKGGKGERLSS